MDNDGLDARWSNDALRDEDLVIARERHSGAIFDETLVPEAAVSFAVMRYVVRGVHLVRGSAQELMLRPGDAFVSSTFGSHPFRSLTTESEVMYLGWRRGTAFGSERVGEGRLRFSWAAHERFLHLAQELSDGCPHASTHAAIAIMHAMRAEGLPLDPGALVHRPAVTSESQKVSRVLERALAFEQQPTSLDLARALGVGEPHALRRVNAHLRRYYRCVRSWREYLRHFRLYFGAFFMGQPGARTEVVARALGFRSPTSFCHAFQFGGLPSPQKVQLELLAT